MTNYSKDFINIMHNFNYISLYKDYVEKRQNRKLALFGAGEHCKRIINQYFAYEEIVALWDNDPEKHGKTLFNIEITLFSQVNVKNKDNFCVIITMEHPFQYYEISEQLKHKGFRHIYPRGILDCANTFWRFSTHNGYNFHELNTFPMIEKNREKIDAVLDILSDEKSKYIFSQWVDRIKYNIGYYADLADSYYPMDAYFEFEFWNWSDNEVFVDGGSLDGTDTIRLSNLLGDKLRKAYVFEPDDNNYISLANNLEKHVRDGEKIRLYKTGLWNETKDLQMMRFGKGGSSLAYQDNALPRGGTIGDVTAIALDDAIDETDRVTIIKLDVEGAEMRVLQGAKQILRNDKPKLAICLYHKIEDIWEIPLFVKSIVPEYKLYVRHNMTNLCEKVLYATV